MKVTDWMTTTKIGKFKISPTFSDISNPCSRALRIWLAAMLTLRSCCPKFLAIKPRSQLQLWLELSLQEFNCSLRASSPFFFCSFPTPYSPEELSRRQLQLLFKDYLRFYWSSPNRSTDVCFRKHKERGHQKDAKDLFCGGHTAWKQRERKMSLQFALSSYWFGNHRVVFIYPRSTKDQRVNSDLSPIYRSLRLGAEPFISRLVYLGRNKDI